MYTACDLVGLCPKNVSIVSEHEVQRDVIARTEARRILRDDYAQGLHRSPGIVRANFSGCKI
jgi:hypothetical protein